MRRLAAVAIVTLFGCTEHPRADVAPAPPPAASAPAPPRRAVVDGHDFPDGVIALTWDDGPDAHTLELATMLARERAPSTFFVVGEWLPGTSAEPGEGESVLFTGYRALPVLGDLVALGHRLGNHTLHHALLHDASRPKVRAELHDNQRAIDPLLTNELRMFRAPGGAFSDEASRAIDEDPVLRSFVGPMGWDVDRKDWEGSLYCRSEAPKDECERVGASVRRVKATVTAARYVSSIASARRGIVLFHDRVGYVGSTYALDVARIVVRELAERGFVFAAPVLRFSPLRQRTGDPGSLDRPLFVADADGDGRGDLCDGVRCALATTQPDETGLPVTRLGPWQPRVVEAQPDNTDVTLPGVDRASVRLGDLNGDGKLDACGISGQEVVCALATSKGFARATTWLTDARIAQARGLALGDVSGDGRADLCIRDARGAHCAMAP